MVFKWNADHESISYPKKLNAQLNKVVSMSALRNNRALIKYLKSDYPHRKEPIDLEAIFSIPKKDCVLRYDDIHLKKYLYSNFYKILKIN